MFQNLLQNHNAHSEHHRIATCIAIALIKNKDKGTQAPFCEFAKAGGVHLITISLKVLMLLTTGLQIVLQIFGSQNTRHYQWSGKEGDFTLVFIIWQHFILDLIEPSYACVLTIFCHVFPHCLSSNVDNQFKS